MSKKKQSKSKQRRLLKKRQRTKKLKKYKNLKKVEEQRIRARKKRLAILALGNERLGIKPQQKGFRIVIYTLWRDLMLLLGKVKCKVGIHDWKLCSGRPGDPMFACIRCWARSKRVWGEDSRDYYKRKENEPKKKT